MPDGEAAVINDAGEDELWAAVSELGDSGGHVLCYKFAQRGNRDVWDRCLRAPVEGFDPDAIAQRYGPGEYRFVVKDAHGRFVQRSSISFAAPTVAGPPAPHPAASPYGGAAPLDHLYQLQQQHQAFQEKILLALIGTLSRGGGGSTAQDIIAALRLGKEMAGSTDTGSIFEGVRSAVALARELAPDGGAEPADLLSSLAGPVINLITEGMKRAGTTPAPGATRAASPLIPRQAPGAAVTRPTAATAGGVRPAAGRAATAGGDSAGAAPPAPPSLAAQYAPAIYQEAAADRDPEVWAVWLAERLPEVYRAPLMEFCNLPAADRLAQLVAVEPRLADHQEWIDEAADRFLEYFEDDDDGEGVDDARADASHADDQLAARRAGDLAHRGNLAPADSAGSRASDGPALRGAAQ